MAAVVAQADTTTEVAKKVAFKDKVHLFCCKCKPVNASLI